MRSRGRLERGDAKVDRQLHRESAGGRSARGERRQDGGPPVTLEIRADDSDQRGKLVNSSRNDMSKVVLFNVTTVTITPTCAGVLEGKSGRGDKELPQTDLSALNGGAEAERLQQRELRKLERKGIGTELEVRERINARSK